MGGLYLTTFSEYADIVTVEEVMKMLGLGRNTVYDLLRSGQIKSRRVGRKYLIAKKSVTDFAVLLDDMTA